MNRTFTRRDWLRSNAAFAVAAAHSRRGFPGVGHDTGSPESRHRIATDHASVIDRSAWEALAQRAVDAARDAGAQYADAKLTRTVIHGYETQPDFHAFIDDMEIVGVGVRAWVGGYWGFSAMPDVDPDVVVQLARDAVAQAKTNAKGATRASDLGRYSAVTGTWSTPVAIDPFTVSIEEKVDTINSWGIIAEQSGLQFQPPGTRIYFIRQERVVATSEGSLFTQTVFESGGSLLLAPLGTALGEAASGAVWLNGVARAGKGWELVLDANIPEQIRQAPAQILANKDQLKQRRPAQVGRHTIVCDGATMASLVEQTIGIGTQLDRALGYEANAGGTSFVDDPFNMVGQFQITSPLVTISANRSAPAQLATVKWDDEGVVPQPFTLVENGMLTDFQTTREQAGWLASYYQKHNRSAASHGCAASMNALHVTMQHMPNLAMAPQKLDASLTDLISSVKDGVLISCGEASTDFQARNGLLQGSRIGLRQISNGRVGAPLVGGAFLFNTMNLWSHVEAVGGAATQDTVSSSQYPLGDLSLYSNISQYSEYEFNKWKGQPAQLTSHSVSAPAALITNQALIDPAKKI